MKAIILIGGEATRLRPLSFTTPKAMVPVLNKPFLEYVLQYLARYEIKDVILTLGNLAKGLEGCFGNGSKFGIRLSYTVEDIPLGTAGAVGNAKEKLRDTFFVLNGDIFTDLDLKEMMDFHRERGAKVTIALTPVEDPRAYGLIETTPEGRVTRFLEKPKPEEITTNMINAGTYIIEPEVLRYIPPRTNFSFERQLFPELLKEGVPVYAFPSSAYWIDIGTPEKYLQLNRDLLNNKSSHFKLKEREIIIGEGSTINPTAQLEGPVLIGKGCSIGAEAKIIGPVVIGDGCSIGQASLIQDSILWRNIFIAPRAEVKSSIIADNCHLEDGCKVSSGCVVGSNVTISRGHTLEPGSRISPGEKVG